MDEKSSVCSTDFCERKVYALGWCDTHYNNLREGPKCSVPGCDRNIRARKMCKKHYVRWQTYGDPEEPLKKAPAGSGSIDEQGYRRITVNGKLRREHRVVMEHKLGRALQPFEDVHHKNSIKTDNHPDNLELWVTPQPRGQRPEDLVEWILENYTEVVLAKLCTSGT